MSNDNTIEATKRVATTRSVNNTQTNFNQKKFSMAEFANSVLPGLLNGSQKVVLPEPTQRAFGG